MDDDLFAHIELEFKIDDLARLFLDEFEKDANSIKTCKLSAEIIQLVKNKSAFVFKINFLGNLGLALIDIIKTKSQSTKNEDLKFLILNSYYCLTKHIDEPFFSNDLILWINRALLLYENFDFFLKQNNDIKLLTGFTSLEHMLINLIYNDLYKNINYDDYTKKTIIDVRTTMEKKFKIIDLNDREIEKIHSQINYKVTNILKEMIVNPNI